MCQNAFIDSIMIPCGHVGCSACLNNSTVECPMCGQAGEVRRFTGHDMMM